MGAEPDGADELNSEGRVAVTNGVVGGSAVAGGSVGGSVAAGGAIGELGGVTPAALGTAG